MQATAALSTPIPKDATGDGKQFYIWGGGMPCTVTLSYCDYKNGSGDNYFTDSAGVLAADNCMNVKPLFVSGSGADYHLTMFSPCIGAGDNSLVPASVTEDLDGKDRIVGTVDMGPYER
jgi:hypothetical protein